MSADKNVSKRMRAAKVSCIVQYIREEEESECLAHHEYYPMYYKYSTSERSQVQ